mgnify:CR=1 FL=1
MDCIKSRCGRRDNQSLAASKPRATSSVSQLAIRYTKTIETRLTSWRISRYTSPTTLKARTKSLNALKAPMRMLPCSVAAATKLSKLAGAKRRYSLAANTVVAP